MGHPAVRVSTVTYGEEDRWTLLQLKQSWVGRIVGKSANQQKQIRTVVCPVVVHVRIIAYKAAPLRMCPEERIDEEIGLDDTQLENAEVHQHHFVSGFFLECRMSA